MKAGEVQTHCHYHLQALKLHFWYKFSFHLMSFLLDFLAVFCFDGKDSIYILSIRYQIYLQLISLLDPSIMLSEQCLIIWYPPVVVCPCTGWSPVSCIKGPPLLRRPPWAGGAGMERTDQATHSIIDKLGHMGVTCLHTTALKPLEQCFICRRSKYPSQ